MRILIGTTVPSTINRFVGPQLDTFLERGWEVHVLASPGDWDEEIITKCHTVHEVPMTRGVSPFRDLKALYKWVGILRNTRPDIVVASTPKAGLVGMVSSRIAAIKGRVFHCRGTRWENIPGLTSKILKIADRLASKCATHVLAVAPSLAGLLQDENITKKPVTVLGAGGSKGVDLDLFSLREPNTSDLQIVGFMGRLTPSKGVDTAVRIANKLSESGLPIRLLVVGESDPSEPISEDLCITIRDTPQIEHVGNVSDPENWLPRMDLLLFPSKREGLPNAVIEAAACGVPSLAWNVTGVRDSILEGVSGFTVPYGDEGAMLKKARVILESPRSYWSYGTRTWAKSFDGKILSESTADYLQEVFMDTNH